MNAPQFQPAIGWSWYPSVVIGFSLWTVLYIWANRGKQTPFLQQIAFHIGTLTGLLALISPLDELGDEYLFSAHMVQHLLLMFVVAPMWLIGTPGWLLNNIVPTRIDKHVNRLLNPLLSFLVFVGVLWIWHVPSIYDMALESEAIHVFEHICFIGAALIGWWPVARARTARFPKLAPPMRIIYLFLLAVPCTALAAILTFSTNPLYPFYELAPHTFGMSALQDQHLGGLLMWLPTHLILLLALGITFAKWFAEENKFSQQNSSRIESIDEYPKDFLKLGA
jgi:putative membrane protein